MSGSDHRPDREVIVEEWGPVVDRIARRLWRTLRLRIDVDDVVQLGMIGLLEAWDRYDEGAGVPFSAWAHYRVRGAMLDGLAALTGMSRAQVRLLQRFRAAGVYQESIAVAAETTAMSDATYLASAVRGVSLAADLVALSDQAEERDDIESGVTGYRPPRPDVAAIERQRAEMIRAVLDRVPPDEAALLRAHYEDGRALADIGSELGISRSWACRLHARAIERVRELLPPDG